MVSCSSVLNYHKFYQRGYALSEILVVIAILVVVSSITYGIITHTLESSRVVKLESDVRTLNAAISSYLAGGGSLAGAQTPQEVLDHLKREASSGEAYDYHDREIMFVRQSFADARVVAHMTPAREGRKAAVWDADAFQFRIQTGQAGVQAFELSDDLARAVKVLERRQVTFRQAKRSGWVWDYHRTSGEGEEQPPDEAVPDPAPKLLEPPRFSLPPGHHPLTFFPETLRILNDNPPDLSETYWKSATSGWQLTNNDEEMIIHPGTELAAYAAARNRVEWQDSSTATANYTAEPVGPLLEWRFPQTRYTYAQAGGEMLPSLVPPPPPPSPGRLELVNGEEIPVVYQNSQYFQAYWTSDGSNPLVSGTRHAGPAFTNGYVGPQLPVSPDLWGASTKVQLQVAAVSSQPLYFYNQPGTPAELEVEVVKLNAPRLMPEQSSLRGNREVTMELPTEDGNMPVGARLYYATQSQDLQEVNGDPQGGTAYTSPIKVPFINGPWTVAARTFVPPHARQWFTPSDIVSRTYTICSEIPQRGAGGALALGVDLSLLGLLHVPIHIGETQGVAPAPFQDSTGLLSVNINAGVNIPLVAGVNVITLLGVAEAQTESDVKAEPTTSLAQATATSNLAGANGGSFSLKVGSVNLLGLLGRGISLPAVLEIRARAVGSQSSVVGEPSQLATDGFATLADASLYISGAHALNLPLNPPPNTGIDLQVLGLAGVTLMLNEQRVVRQTGSAEIETTALAVRITALQLAPGVPTLSGEIRIGQSRAALRGTVCP